MAEKITKAVRKYASSIQAPSSEWKRSESEGVIADLNSTYEAEGSLAVRLEKSDVVIIFNLGRADKFDRERKKAQVSIDGSTYYKHDDRWHSFDRIGVCSSFYGTDSDKPDPAVIITDQLKRIAESRALRDRMTPIPDNFGWSVTPERRQEITKQLQRGERVTFMPGGFGTGKILEPTPSSRYCRPAGKAIARFFGVAQVWLSTFDAD